MAKVYTKVLLRLEPKVKREIEALAYMQGKTQTDIIRRAIEKLLNEPHIRLQLRDAPQRIGQ